MGRILYECLDLNFPTGGARRLYRHVEVLRKHGFDARMLHHTPGFVLSWFSSSAQVDYWTDDYEFFPDDVLVIPEGHTGTMRNTKDLPCRRLVIALNWANIFRNLRLGENWRSLGITNAIAGSLYEHQFILSTMGIQSATIVSGIDAELFSPANDKQCRITYMPRKNPEYFHLIAAVFRSKFPEYASVPFISIEMLPHVDVAKIFSESAIFLAHTFPEGLSRKTLEAMACGNIVVGFAGHGSLECMNHKSNCYLADDGDVLVAAELLGLAVSDFYSGRSVAMREAAITTARTYSLEREEKTIVKFWTTFLKSNA
jgi:hypothetical protein